MTDEFRPDDPTPLTREAITPRRDRWLMPLLAAGCTLAGVAMGFVMGQRTALAPHETAPPVAVRSADPFKVDVNLSDDDLPRAFAFNWHGFDHRVMAPMPPMPPGSRELVVNNCGDDDDDASCTTIIKRKADGSVVIVKTRKQ